MNKIWEALDYLGPNGEKWMKGLLKDGDRACLLGALVACGVEQESTTPEYLAIGKAIQEQFPDRYPGEPHLPYFNDDDKTTFDDVRVVMQKGAVALDEMV